MSKSITVPFCYLPNSLSQTFDLSTSTRTEFQANTLLEISQRKDFAYFITCQHERKLWLMVDNHPSCKGPCYIAWYDKAGQMHTMKVGAKKILAPEYVTTSKASIVELDSPVYKSRTNATYPLAF